MPLARVEKIYGKQEHLSMSEEEMPEMAEFPGCPKESRFAFGEDTSLRGFTPREGT